MAAYDVKVTSEGQVSVPVGIRRMRNLYTDDFIAELDRHAGCSAASSFDRHAVAHSLFDLVS